MLLTRRLQPSVTVSTHSLVSQHTFQPKVIFRPSWSYAGSSPRQLSASTATRTRTSLIAIARPHSSLESDDDKDSNFTWEQHYQKPASGTGGNVAVMSVDISICVAPAGLPSREYKTISVQKYKLAERCPALQAALSQSACVICASGYHSVKCYVKPIAPDSPCQIELWVSRDAEAKAYEHCLNYLQTQKLPGIAKTSGDIASCSLTLVYHTAKNLIMADCCAACIEVLKSLDPSCITAAMLTAADALLFGYTIPAKTGNAVGKEVKGACCLALAAHFGDIAVTIVAGGQKNLQEQWISLPYTALIDLLRSDYLITDHENSVLHAVDVWAQRNNPSKIQAHALIGQVRVLQLSAGAFFTSLPDLHWLMYTDVLEVELRSSSELLRLVKYAIEDAGARARKKTKTAAATAAGFPAMSNLEQQQQEVIPDLEAWSNEKVRPKGAGSPERCGHWQSLAEALIERKVKFYPVAQLAE